MKSLANLWKQLKRIINASADVAPVSSDSTDPVRIATLATSEQAYLARSILADNDIPAFVENELANLYTPALMTGFSLIVAERDLTRAEPIIRQFLSSLNP